MSQEKPQLVKLRSSLNNKKEDHLFLVQSKHTALESLDEGSEIEEIKPNLSDRLSSSKPSSLSEIGFFFSNLEKLTRTGISLVDSIRICIGSAKSPRFKGVLCDLYGAIKNEGLSLSSAIEKTHPGIFGKTTIAIIKSAEISGDLKEALRVLVKSIDSSSKLQKQVKGALAYPIAMLIFALLSLLTILLFVLPKMQASFESMGADLPPITVFMLKMSEIVQSQTWTLLLLILVPFIVFRFIKSKKDSAPIRYILSKTPIVNGLQKEESLLKSFQVLSILLRTGTSLPEGHAVALEVAHLKNHKKFFGKIKEALEAGKNLTTSYQENQWILGEHGREIAQMVKIGETSNSIAEMLLSLSESLEENAAIKAALLPKLVQPVSTILLFSVVGVMAAAIYLPQFQLVMQVMER